MDYGGNVPYWVSKQNEALIESSHRQLEHQYLDKIKALARATETIPRIKKNTKGLGRRNQQSTVS